MVKLFTIIMIFALCIIAAYVNAAPPSPPAPAPALATAPDAQNSAAAVSELSSNDDLQGSDTFGLGFYAQSPFYGYGRVYYAPPRPAAVAIGGGGYGGYGDYGYGYGHHRWGYGGYMQRPIYPVWG